MREWEKNNQERIACNHYRKRYGITLVEVKEMLLAQGSKCAICKKEIRIDGAKGRDKAVVDHCHNSSKVRGLLCTPCNLMIGYSYDNEEILQSAIDYLKEE